MNISMLLIVTIADWELLRLSNMLITISLGSRFSVTRGSHLYVPCRSVCNRNQNRIKRSKHSLRANQGIKGASKLWKSRIRNAWLQFDLWPIKNQAIKGSQKGRSSDQAHFLPIKNLDPGHKHFNRQHVSDYPLSYSLTAGSTPKQKICVHHRIRTRLHRTALATLHCLIFFFFCMQLHSINEEKVICYQLELGK